MAVIAMITILCIVGAITGIKLVNQETMDAEAWGLIGVWALLAAAVVAVVLRRGRDEARRAESSGDG